MGQDWSFTPADSRQSARITMDMACLVRMLTAPTTLETRHEWARHLILQAQERLPDAPLRHLWTSVGREGWEAHRQRQRSRPRGMDEAAGSNSVSKGAVAREREAFATELSDMVREMRRAMAAQGLGRSAALPDTKLSSGLASNDALVTTAEFTPDVLRAGRAFASTVPSGGPATEASGANKDVASGSYGQEAAVLFCQPAWAAVDGGQRLQATLRFDPGIAHGDTVFVASLEGEPLALQIPPGLMNVQRVLASVPSHAGPARRWPAAGSSAAGSTRPPLRIDIAPLPPDAAPGMRLTLGDVAIVLPSYVAPATSLIFATPAQGQQGEQPNSRPPPSALQQLAGKAWQPAGAPAADDSIAPPPPAATTISQTTVVPSAVSQRPSEQPSTRKLPSTQLFAQKMPHQGLTRQSPSTPPHAQQSQATVQRPSPRPLQQSHVAKIATVLAANDATTAACITTGGCSAAGEAATASVPPSGERTVAFQSTSLWPATTGVDTRSDSSESGVEPIDWSRANSQQDSQTNSLTESGEFIDSEDFFRFSSAQR